MHESAENFIRSAVGILPHLHRVVEFGSKIHNQSIRFLFARETDHYWGIDLEPGQGVNEVADAATWTPPELVECVICCEVFEHTPDAEKICRNAHRILKPGGIFLVTCASGNRPEHGHDGGPLQPGEYYQNVTKAELATWLVGFRAVINDRIEGDLYALAIKKAEEAV